jgi:hypothetical protein
MHLGSNRCKQRQSLSKFQGSGGPSPMMYTLTRARSQCCDNQKSTSGLHSMWHILNFVQITSKCNLNWTSSLSQLFMRYRNSSSEKGINIGINKVDSLVHLVAVAYLWYILWQLHSMSNSALYAWTKRLDLQCATLQSSRQC